MTRNNQTVRVDPSVVPEPDAALQQFQSNSGHSSELSPYGQDPLEGHSHSAQRESLFFERYPDFGAFLHSVVNGDYSLFHEGLLYFLDLSRQLEGLIIQS